jgi:2-oxoisovalerate dehydrogenase E1 component
MMAEPELGAGGMAGLSAVPDACWQSAILIRSFEERLLRLFTEGAIFGTVHTCIGQEFTGVAIAQAIEPDDVIFSNHRCHGHYLARTDDVDGLMAEIMGRQTGICGGRGGSQHICSGNVFSNGIQGGGVPIAGGVALARKLQGSTSIGVVFIGDGTLGEGVLYEALNMASKWTIPLLIVLENNHYAQSSSSSQTLAGDVMARPGAFGIRTFEADTWRPGRLFDVARATVGYVRSAAQPAFLAIDTYRLMAHSKGDDQRDADELRHHWEIDPIRRFEASAPDRYADMRRRADERIDAAISAAEPVAFATPAVATETAPGSVRWEATRAPERRERIAARIGAALHTAMADDGRVICIGEDIQDPYGGAFKVTSGLSTAFPGRVLNTPISEAALVGICNGLALGGMVPVCEIMFGDFMTLAMDQILNHAAKFRYMYNGQVSVPLVVRTPMGGRRGYGATHSQSIEKHFLGIPDTMMLAIHHRFDPLEIYRRIFAGIQMPTIVIENKTLYGRYSEVTAPEGFHWEHSDEMFPTSRLTVEQRPDVTILCYGGMLPEVEGVVDALVDEFEVIPEVVCPVSLYPLNIQPIIDSVTRSGRLVVVEEGQGFCAFGAEVIARIVEESPGSRFHYRRLSAAPAAVPSCKPTEEQMLPGTQAILAACVEVCGL